MLDVCLPGTGGMMPLPNRWLSCAIVRAEGRAVLLDCGEGTQVALKEIHFGFRAIDAICLSHFHADHVSGLVGLLLMLANSDRDEPVTVFGPPGVAEVVAAQRVLAPFLPFEVRTVVLRPGATFRVEPFVGTCAAAKHSGPCLAYRLALPRGRPFLPERAQALGLPISLWRTLQRGETVEHEGRRVEPDEVLGPPRRGITVVYVTDSRPTPALVDLSRDADLLISEATFGDPADQPRAVETRHMTFVEAATLARQAGVRRLWLTHFSPALPNPLDYASQATVIFPGAVVGRDGQCETLRYEDPA
ncbi:MAG: ribonuclease Z [Chloroflexi bacterium]|nr:ribonuclease Z [Chloroflexota bacterium]